MRTFHRQQYRPRKFYSINHRIEASELRVIDGKGGLIGVISKEEALKLAAEQNVDLVLIAAQAKPPVAKIIDFKKFLYQEEKKEKEAKKGIKKSGSKNISLSLFIGVADLLRLENKAIDFLKDGYQVRINLLLKGREVIKKPMAFDLVNKFMANLGEINISKPPRLEGRVIRAVVAKKK